ncbi:hypothetical protein SNE40_000214 [Patella caerulea]|uniref:Uncharacterized protein n=1 Tax=Patella caerulea TaxID=87958 RepID=A0AAN8QGP8_PATCE
MENGRQEEQPYTIPNNIRHNSDIVETEVKRLRVVRFFRNVSFNHVPLGILTIVVSIVTIFLVTRAPRLNFATVTPILVGFLGIVSGIAGFYISKAALYSERIEKSVSIQVIIYIIVGTCILLLVPLYTGFSAGICDPFTSILCPSATPRDITLGALNIATCLLLFLSISVNFCLILCCQKSIGVGFLSRYDNLYERISMSDRKEPSFQLALRDDCYLRLQNGGDDFPDLNEDCDKRNALQSVENGYYTWDSPPSIET